MSVTKYRILFAVAALVASCGGAVNAQLFQPFNVPAITTDYQFFAPRDIDTFGGRPAYKTGWYASYDRLYMNVSRPEYQLIDRNNNQPPETLASDRIGDFTWGTQMELGFVDENRRGWGFRYFRIGGPNANETQLLERVNRFITPPDPDADPTGPPHDVNNPAFLFRAYNIKNSVNLGKLSSIELNRSWLWKPLHNGGTLEPFVGVRYTQFTNQIRRQTYERFDATGLPIPPGNTSQTTQDTAVSERLTTDNRFFLNDLVGGQAGIRFTKPYRRINLNGDARFFAFQNFQNFQQNLRQDLTFYGSNAIDTIPTVIRVENNSSADSTNEFVWGGEARITAALEVTRDITLQAGFNVVYFGQGIGRGFTPTANSEDLLLFGFNFGGSVNR